MSNIREWTISGNVKMVIATSNDEINYRNLFVVLPLMNREVTLKTPFERDLNQINELSWLDLRFQVHL